MPKGGKSDIANAISGVISAGTSLSDTARAFATLDYVVCFQLTVENYTNQHLGTHENKIHSGSIKEPAVAIMPGMKEGLAGHKSSGTATGCAGTVSWKIGNTDKILVVMYSLPYSHDFHSNWCGVGIFDVQDTTDFFDKMYNGSEVDFKRKDFWSDLTPVEYTDNSMFRVTASMGASHKADVTVQLYPEEVSMLAKSLRKDEGLGRK